MTGLTRKPRRHRVRDTVRDTEQGETPWEDRGSESDRNTNGKPGETEVPSERVGDGETDSRRAAARAESSKAWPRGGTGADPEKQRTLAPGRWVRRQSHAATAPTGEPRRRAGSGRGGCSGVAGAGRRPPVKTGYRVWIQAAVDLRRRVQVPRAVARNLRAGTTTAAPTQAAPASSAPRSARTEPRTFWPCCRPR